MKFPEHRQIIGKSSIHLESIGSTNEFALNLIAKSNPIEGTVISADFQVQGRGQRNKNWQSDPNKNILLSLILYPRQLTAGNQFYLSMMTANAVISVLETVLSPEKLSIKWPNDIYFESRKLAGILIQNNLKGGIIESSVIGLGLNVNQEQFDPGLPNPTSIILETKRRTKTKELTEQLLNILDVHYLMLINGDHSEIKNNYQNRLYNKGLTTEINCQQGVIQGVILGVEQDGRLLVNVDGKVKKLCH